MKYISFFIIPVICCLLFLGVNTKCHAAPRFHINKGSKPFKIRIDDSTCISLPTAFTPGIDGMNDFYHIIGIGLDKFRNFKMSVYSTNHHLVYRTSDINAPWDGKDSKGHMCTSHRYQVKIRVTSPGGKAVKANTHVFLLSYSTKSGCINVKKADMVLYTFEDQLDAASGTTPYKTHEFFCK